MKDKKITISEEQAGKRLDALLTELDLERDISRSYAKQLIEEDAVLVNSKKSKPSYKLKEGDELKFELPEIKELKLEAEDIFLDIIYEDDDLMLINKQAGLVTHPAPGVFSGTLVNAVLHHTKTTGAKLSDINGVLRPGIVHRLDKDTTGLILVAKSNLVHKSLAEQIKNRTCSRQYVCLVQAKFPESKFSISKAIGRHPKDRIKMHYFDSFENSSSARYACTHFSEIDNFYYKNKNYSLLEAKLDTGRTHQIRVHLASLKKPIMGDLLYGASDKLPFKLERPLLHSRKIKFTHPVLNKEMSFEVDLPEDMQRILWLLRAG